MQNDTRMVVLSPHSASLSGGNLVDGLPSALHTEALGGPHGGVGPATIHELDIRNLSFEGKCCGKSNQRFVQVLDRIFMLLVS